MVHYILTFAKFEKSYGKLEKTTLTYYSMYIYLERRLNQV